MLVTFFFICGYFFHKLIGYIYLLFQRVYTSKKIKMTDLSDF